MKKKKEFNTKEILEAVIAQLCENFHDMSIAYNALAKNGGDPYELFLALTVISTSMQPAFDYIEEIDGLCDFVGPMKEMIEFATKQGVIEEVKTKP